MSDTVRLDALKAATCTEQLIDPELCSELTEDIQKWLNGSSYTAMYTEPHLAPLCDILMRTIHDKLTDGCRVDDWEAVQENISWKSAVLTHREHGSVMGYTEWDDSGHMWILFDSGFLHELDELHKTNIDIAAAMFVTVLLHEVAHCLTKGDGMEGGAHNNVYWAEAVYIFRHTPIHAAACIAAATLFCSSDYVVRLVDTSTADSVLGLIDACCI